MVRTPQITSVYSLLFLGREETQLLIKKQEIIELKEKKAQLLENRVQAIILSRQAKAAANRGKEILS